MKLILYCNDDFCSELGSRIKRIDSSENRFYVLGRQGDNGTPPVPANVLKDIPLNSSILYNIFSLDCCQSPEGSLLCEKLSEKKALELAENSKIFQDKYSMTAYFRYRENSNQHTVWLEDTYHVMQKLSILEAAGYTEVGLCVNELSICTVTNLIHTNRYSI